MLSLGSLELKHTRRYLYSVSAVLVTQYGGREGEAEQDRPLGK